MKTREARAQPYSPSGMPMLAISNFGSDSSTERMRAISTILAARSFFTAAAPPCMWDSATYPPLPSLLYAYAIPADTVWPPVPRHC